MAWHYNPPPGWPTPPPGWTPPPDWTPDPTWPPAPPGWQFWVADTGLPPAGTPPPGERRRSRAGPIAAIVVVVLVALVAVAAVSRFAGETDTQQLATRTDVAAVRIENDCGSITVRPGSAGVVRTEARLTSRWNTPQVTSRDDGDEVVVEAQCSWFGGSVRLAVEVPQDAPVQARSAAGQVEASGLQGPLILSSSAGSVSGADLGSDEVEAQSSAGSVTLGWTADADPQRVDASSSAGSVTVLLPDQPNTAYSVEAESSAGSTTVDVRTDPSATRTVRAHSSAGSVTVSYP